MSIFYMVLLQSENSWSNLYAVLGQLFFLIFAFVVVIFLAYFSTRWIATNKQLSKYLGRGTSNLKVVEKTAVGVQANVQLIKVGTKHILIGVTKDRITYLTDVSSDEIEQNDPTQ